MDIACLEAKKRIDIVDLYFNVVCTTSTATSSLPILCTCKFYSRRKMSRNSENLINNLACDTVLVSKVKDRYLS